MKGDSLTPPAPHSAAALMVCVCVSRGPKTENSSTLRPDDGRSVPNGTLRTQPEGRWVSSRGSEQHAQKQHSVTAARVAVLLQTAARFNGAGAQETQCLRRFRPDDGGRYRQASTAVVFHPKQPTRKGDHPWLT